jgi:hypothetical protein
MEWADDRAAPAVLAAQLVHLGSAEMLHAVVSQALRLPPAEAEAGAEAEAATVAEAEAELGVCSLLHTAVHRLPPSDRMRTLSSLAYTAGLVPRLWARLHLCVTHVPAWLSPSAGAPPRSPLPPCTDESSPHASTLARGSFSRPADALYRRRGAGGSAVVGAHGSVLPGVLLLAAHHRRRGLLPARHPAASRPAARAGPSAQGAPRSDLLGAIRQGLDWAIAHAAVLARPPNPSNPNCSPDRGLLHVAQGWASPVVQGPFPVASCQARLAPFATTSACDGNRSRGGEEVFKNFIKNLTSLMRAQSALSVCLGDGPRSLGKARDAANSSGGSAPLWRSTRHWLSRLLTQLHDRNCRRRFVKPEAFHSLDAVGTASMLVSEVLAPLPSHPPRRFVRPASSALWPFRRRPGAHVCR